MPRIRGESLDPLTLDGEGLGTMWGEQKARELLREAGFSDPDVFQVEGDIVNSYYVARLADAARRQSG